MLSRLATTKRRLHGTSSLCQREVLCHGVPCHISSPSCQCLRDRYLPVEVFGPESGGQPDSRREAYLFTCLFYASASRTAGSAQNPAQQAELAQTLEMFKSLNESPAPEARPPKKARGAASAASRDLSPAPSRLKPSDKVCCPSHACLTLSNAQGQIHASGLCRAAQHNG